MSGSSGSTDFRRKTRRRVRPAGPKSICVEIAWTTGSVRWRDRPGIFRRHIDLSYVEGEIGERVYCICKAELRPG
jgi:hypothetical protein